MRRRCLQVLALVLLIALPAAAADRVIQNGIDVWLTKGDGSTFIDFSKSPIPAGFFCFKSAPFAGRIVFQGVPIATGEPGVLGQTDTIVQRLDDAVFNKAGVATTRIQMKAMHFVSVKPIETSCGAFTVEVKLNGEQPVTRMRIVRNGENGGTFYAPIAVNGKLAFTAVDRPGTEVLELTRNVRFPANQGIRWSNKAGEGAIRRTGYVLIDTDNDKVADTYVPGTSNFAAGWPRQTGRTPLTRDFSKVYQNSAQLDSFGCHSVDDEGHCPIAN